ncbi:hypothetical protein CRI94_17345 [Longibacter salinarum]|uniref:Uncharacterized protein n=1 Tax=Longibacter salinarum TaxID=1850348 RepID=A0A2A8CTH4_9BACT|nr:hypothetical protein [Longibacter salinarum]PEN10382.1 hypothetical protein CRI94_17345 [Longibacter salinarum]
MPTLEKRLSNVEAAARGPWTEAWCLWQAAVFEPMDCPETLLEVEAKHKAGDSFDMKAKDAAQDLMPTRWRTAGGWSALDNWFCVEAHAILDAVFPEDDAPPALNLYPEDIPAPPIVPTPEEIGALDAETEPLTAPRGYAAASMRILAGLARRHALHIDQA